MKRLVALPIAGLLVTAAMFATAGAESRHSDPPGPPTHATATPIQHLVVIFQENVSFDHYFGTYPNATNPTGEPAFNAAPDTPGVNGLSPALLNNNPNAANPTRLDRSQALTCDQDHDYPAEQLAFDHGLMDKFVENTQASDCRVSTPTTPATPGATFLPSLVMDYYDGNTVTGLWNYAQRFSMSDNSYGTTFGPSTPGAINLISGQTHGATVGPVSPPEPGESTAPKVSNGTDIGDLDPALDDCGKKTRLTMSGKNVGDLLNAKGATWGWFQGGFKPTSRAADGTATCGASHTNIAGNSAKDYSPHHEPFQYYAQTANPHHLPPSSPAMIGHTDQANHQYDISDFWTAANSGNLPQVSFLKAPEYQDGHAGYSDPIDEQHFLVDTINQLQKLPTWSSTAVVIAYDDSDGWYDHVMGPIVNQSNDPANDALTGPGTCGTAKPGAYQDRCGYGPRLPLLVISPWAKQNYVDHSLTDQSSILRFIEDNWGLGRIGDQSADAQAGAIDTMFNFSQRSEVRPYFLDPASGEPTGSSEGNEEEPPRREPPVTESSPHHGHGHHQRGGGQEGRESP